MSVAISVRGLTKKFQLRQQRSEGGGVAEVTAVRDLDLDVMASQTVGLVGESGSGKTTTAMMIAGLLEPSAGTIEVDGRPMTGLKGRELRSARRSVQVVFQDPYTSLNPRYTVRKIIGEPLRISGVTDDGEVESRVDELLEMTGIPGRHADRTPDAFSGGQRQRIAIARALALRPPVLVCDEPTSALDVSVQARIINLLQDIQAETGVTILFVSHDLNVVRLVTQRVAVMYLGRVVESGATAEVFDSPQHPYTQALVRAIPDPKRRVELEVLEGEIPSNIDLPSGCAFKSRCVHRMDICDTDPGLVSIGDRTVRCHLVAENGS